MGEADRRSLHGHGVEAALLLRLSEHGGDVVPRDPEVPVGGQVDEYAVDEPQRQQRHQGLAQARQDRQSHPHGYDGPLVDVADARELPHAVHDRIVAHARHAVGAQGLHAVDVLHDGAGVARAHFVLVGAVDLDLAP